VTPRTWLALIAAAGLLAAASPAAAQSQQATAPPQAPRAAAAIHPRVIVALEGGAQLTTMTSGSAVTFKLYGEDARLNVDYRTPVSPVYGARTGVRVWRQLMVGAGVTLFAGNRDAALTAALPHPFHFQRPRALEGTASALERDETAVYAEVGWHRRFGRKWDAVVFAGPAFFRATQEAATRVRFNEQYPYDTATYSDVDTASRKTNATGFTLGADVAYRIGRTFSAGALVRYARATADVTPVDGQRFRITLGGLQATAGLRLRF